MRGSRPSLFMIIPNTKRHPKKTKMDQLPISEVITGLPRPYHNITASAAAAAAAARSSSSKSSSSKSSSSKSSSNCGSTTQRHQQEQHQQEQQQQPWQRQQQQISTQGTGHAQQELRSVQKVPTHVPIANSSSNRKMICRLKWCHLSRASLEIYFKV